MTVCSEDAAATSGTGHDSALLLSSPVTAALSRALFQPEAWVSSVDRYVQLSSLIMSVISGLMSHVSAVLIQVLQFFFIRLYVY